MAKYRFIAPQAWPIAMPMADDRPWFDWAAWSMPQSNVTIFSSTSMETLTFPEVRFSVSKVSTEPRFSGGSFVNFSWPSMNTRPKTRQCYKILWIYPTSNFKKTHIIILILSKDIIFSFLTKAIHSYTITHDKQQLYSSCSNTEDFFQRSRLGSQTRFS